MVVDAATGTMAESFTHGEFGDLLSGTNGSQLIPFGSAGGDPATGSLPVQAFLRALPHRSRQ